MKTDLSNAGCYDLGGTIRARLADETLAWLLPKLPDMGITRVANITGLDEVGIHVTTCMRPNAKHLSVSQGKGISLTLAKISAIMESIEGYHAENPPPALLTSTYKALQSKHSTGVINPTLFQLGDFSVQSLIDYPLAWICATEISSGASCYIPQIVVCIDSTIDRPEYALFSVSSNGLAAGNSYEEALCHALYEIIERDALWHWQQLTDDQRQQTRVNINAINVNINKQLIDRLLQKRFTITLWDITSRVGIPAYHCSIQDNNALRRLSLFTGTGAHLSKDIALSRAITEALQGRLTYITGSRDDVFIDYYQRQRAFDFLTSQVTENTEVIKETKKIKETRQQNYPFMSACSYQTSLLDNLKQITSLLNEKGYREIFVVDHTKPALQIPVVHAFVPGMKFNGARM